MPQLKSPISLYQAALQSVKDIILSTCLHIQQRFGDYNEHTCQLAATEFQRYLVENLPGKLIDILFNTTKAFSKVIRQKLDFRIWFSVHMHTNMQRFCPRIKMNFDDNFWLCKFQNMKSLIILDLNCICTDEILQIIGKNCKNLKVINVVSKTKQMICSFNALKVAYFVSDLGLRYLSECKNLKVVIMPRVIRSQASGVKLTPGGILYMLKSLPKLKLITYSDIGTVLNQYVSLESPMQLSLSSIILYQCDNLQTSLILQVCPHLTELYLDLSKQMMNAEVGGNISETFRILATSDVKLTTLSAYIFNFCDNFKLFLKNKGRYTQNISLTVYSEFSEIDVMYLAECCPSVEKVCLTTSVNFYESNVYNIPNAIFTELKYLGLKMFEKSLIHILPLFLKNAIKIKQIKLNSKDCCRNHNFDKIIDNMMVLNSCLELEELNLGIGPFDNLIKFILFCPLLKKVTINDTLVNPEYFCQINRYLRSRNMNIVVKPSNGNEANYPFFYNFFVF